MADFQAYPASNSKSRLLNFLDASPAANTYYYFNEYGQLTCGYRHLTLTGKITATTNLSSNVLTIECTNDEDLATAAPSWATVYAYDCVNNTNVSNITATGTGALVTVTYALSLDVFNFYAYRIKLIVGDAAASAQTIKGRLST